MNHAKRVGYQCSSNLGAEKIYNQDTILRRTPDPYQRLLEIFLPLQLWVYLSLGIPLSDTLLLWPAFKSQRNKLYFFTLVKAVKHQRFLAKRKDVVQITAFKWMIQSIILMLHTTTLHVMLFYFLFITEHMFCELIHSMQ